MKDQLKVIFNLLKKNKAFSRLNFIILYGSHSKGTSTPLSDIDLCLSLSLGKKERDELRLRLVSSLPDKYDLHLFEDLPSYVQVEVLKGKVLYVKNYKDLVERAISLIKEFEDFERIYTYYLSRNKAEASL